MTTSSKALWAAAAALVFIGAQAAVGQVPAVKREPAQPLRTVDGAENYRRYCAPCHGVDLKGHGPAAPAFKVPPTDLTTFAKRHGGTFSHVDLDAHITGMGQPVTAHGSSDMPTWGPIFKSISPDDGDLKLRVANLVKYIESMQAK